jgi:hypothetical protein
VEVLIQTEILFWFICHVFSGDVSISYKVASNGGGQYDNWQHVGHAVAQWLRHYARIRKGRGFEILSSECFFFSIYLILQAALGLGMRDNDSYGAVPTHPRD